MTAPTGFELRVPCSTSNLGPGFDCLGLALELFLHARLEVGGSGPLERRAPAEFPATDDDLIVRALARGLSAAGRGTDGLRLEWSSEIPIARGLGSSGAAVAAGLRLAQALAPAALDDAELLELGIELEGHPDNVTASLLGGLVHTVPGAFGPRRSAFLRHRIAPGLALAVAWPEARLSTERARAALPASVPLEHAVENARRLPLLLEGLTGGSPEALRAGGRDALHVPYRLPLLPGAAAALERATAEGAHLATISGSGSALVAVAPRERCADIAAAMADCLRTATGAATARVLEPVSAPPLPTALG